MITSALQSIFWPKTHRLTKEILLVLGAALFLGVAAQLSIPLQPVPLTFQSITVILIGMALGARLGTYAIFAYLLIGIAGLPVFANFSSGPGVFLGPTAGYLVGFVPAATLSGFLAQKGFAQNFFRSFIAGFLGAVVIFSFGILWLVQFTGWHQALVVGLKPFILSESMKLIILSLCAKHFWKHG